MWIFCVFHLGKHIATQCVIFNLQKQEVSDVANFMGHADKIDHNYYRMPITSREISLMSQLLERARDMRQLKYTKQWNGKEINFIQQK